MAGTILQFRETEMRKEELRQNWEQDDRDMIVEHRLNFCRSLYNDTQNRLYVWQAISLLADSGKEYPNWVRTYLSDVAEAILNIREPGKEAPAMTKGTLGLDSAKAFADFHYSWRKDYAYDRVIEERENREHGEKGYDIYADVGEEFNVSADKIKKWFLDVKKWRDSIVSDT